MQNFIVLLVVILFASQSLAQTFVVGAYTSNNIGNVCILNFEKSGQQRIVHSKPARYIDVDYNLKTIYWTAFDGNIYSGDLLQANQNQIIYTDNSIVGLHLDVPSQKIYFFVNGSGLKVLDLQNLNASAILIYNTTDTPIDAIHSITKEVLYFITAAPGKNKVCYMCTLVNNTCVNVTAIFTSTAFGFNAGFTAVAENESIWFFDWANNQTDINIYSIDETLQTVSLTITIVNAGFSYELQSFEKVNNNLFFTCKGCYSTPTLAQVPLAATANITVQQINGVTVNIGGLRLVSATPINISDMSMITVSFISMVLAILLILVNY